MAAATEVYVEIANQPGALGEVSEALGKAGVNIDGFGVWNDRVRLLVGDVERALAVLRAAGFTCGEQQVLRLDVPDEPGTLAELARELGRAGINIDYAYTVTARDDGACAFVLAVVDPRAAEKALR